jgi:hypothetical protein
MHLANASAPGGRALGRVEPALAAVDAELLAPPAVAVELGELAPHPATKTPITSVAAASRRTGPERLSRFGWMLSCI